MIGRTSLSAVRRSTVVLDHMHIHKNRSLQMNQLRLLVYI